MYFDIKLGLIGFSVMGEVYEKRAKQDNSDDTVIDTRASVKNIPLFRCEAPTHLETWPANKRDKKKLVYPEMKNRDILNMFRNLRTKLMTAAKDKNFSLLISSAVPGGGASFIASNIASVIAMQRAKSAILIDANLYNPDITKLFELEGKPGLSEYLAGDMGADQAVLYPTGVPNLYVMPAGNVVEEGLELFTGDRMKRLIKNMTDRLPRVYVVLDVPSLNDSADTPILLQSCQKSMLVLPSEGVHQEKLEASIESMKLAEFVGAVYNNNRL